MANERPQLSLHELHQLRWLLGGLVALISLWSVWYIDQDAWPLLGLGTACVFLVLWRPAWPGLLPLWSHRLAFPAILAAFVFDFYTFGQILPSLVRLALLLLLYRVVTYRKRRDDLQVVLLGLFLVVVAGVLTVSVGFSLQIVAFAAAALGLLLTRGLVDVAETGRDSMDGTVKREVPPWTRVNWGHLFHRLIQVSDWRVWLFAVALFATLVGLSAGLFLVIPRFQIESSLFLDRWMNRRSVTGFTDTLRFGEVSDIQKDDGVALRVEVSDPRQLPAQLYWRMIVMDEYRDQAFRLSAALRQASFGRQVTDWRVPGFAFSHQSSAGQWTFYLEPRVSRYLPLLSEFRALYFTEPQVFRTSSQLQLVELARDPATMKAYRVDHGSLSPAIQDPLFGRRLGSPTSRILPPTTLEVPFPPGERDRWARAAAGISRGRILSARAFAREATDWLQQHHAYSLQSTLSKGGEDPLTRWTFSEHPGHCELFAGAFVMLARSAGFPARIVGGFAGGTWNGDYLIVRNSNAHAWGEIFDESGAWLRVDPTVPASTGGDSAQEAASRGQLGLESGWTAQLDRLRMFWYRRIVNFDRRDQLNLVRNLRATTESSGKQLRLWLDRCIGRLMTWAARPWDVRRAAVVALPPLLLLWLAWVWRRRGRDWWLSWRASRSAAVNPVRREAGRWLERFAVAGRGGAIRPVDTDEVETALQRLRYGPPQSWPAPEAVFRRAASVTKEWRRAARRAPSRSR